MISQLDRRALLQDFGVLNLQTRFLVLSLLWISILVSAFGFVAPSAHASSSTSRSSYPSGLWQPEEAQFTSIVTDFSIKMDDGVELSASVAFPADRNTGKRADGSFPVILEHTPYVHLSAPVVPNTYMAEHGYIYAVVHARGTGASEGEMQQFGPRDGRDGQQIIEWAAHGLEGSDGRVGLLGCSYPGALALTNAAYAGPNSPVKAAIAACIGLNMQQRQVWMMNGLPSASLSNFPSRSPALMGSQTDYVRRYFAGFAANIFAGGSYAYDGEYWENRIPLSHAKSIVDNNIPLLLWSGWGDIVETGAIQAYTALQNAVSGRNVYLPMEKNQKADPRFQLIMGGWHHAKGLNADVFLQWFDTWLKGKKTGFETTSTPLHMFETGTNRWINTSQFPAVSDYTNWFFSPEGKLELQNATVASESTLAFGDPADKNGKLLFATPVFKSGVILSGPLSATIYARSSNTNMELIGRLFDVDEKGTASEISSGALLGSLSQLDESKSWKDSGGTVIWPWPEMKEDSYLEAGKVYRFDLSLRARQWGVLPGHFLRLELTTQSPHSICPPEGEGDPENVTEPCRLTAPQKATLPGGVYHIMSGPEWPSTLNLPQIEAGSQASVPSLHVPNGWNESFRKVEDSEYTLPSTWGGQQ